MTWRAPARRVEIVRGPDNRIDFDVDGQPFPHAVAEEGPTLERRGEFLILHVPVIVLDEVSDRTVI